MLPVRPRATGQDALGLDEVRARAFRREPGARGLYPKSKPPFLRVVLIYPALGDVPYLPAVRDTPAMHLIL